MFYLLVWKIEEAAYRHEIRFSSFTCLYERWKNLPIAISDRAQIHEHKGTSWRMYRTYFSHRGIVRGQYGALRISYVMAGLCGTPVSIIGVRCIVNVGNKYWGEGDSGRKQNATRRRPRMWSAFLWTGPAGPCPPQCMNPQVSSLQIRSQGEFSRNITISLATRAKQKHYNYKSFVEWSKFVKVAMEECYGGGQGGGEGRCTAVFQGKYLSCLMAVMRRGRIERATSVSVRTRAVKLAADLSLICMSTARRRTQWSRAILGKYLFKLNKVRCQSRLFKWSANSHGRRISASSKTTRCKKIVSRLMLGALSRSGTGILSQCDEQRRRTVVSRMQTFRLLIPGSRRLDTPVFLEEAADYIIALKMQVQAMQALADSYSNSSAYAAYRV